MKKFFSLFLLTANCLLSVRFLLMILWIACWPIFSPAQFIPLWIPQQTNNPSTGVDIASALTSDASGIYVAGYEDLGWPDYQWRIEKRSLITGALITAFGAAGVVTSNPSGDDDHADAITVDASGIYVAGIEVIPGNNRRWRMEKRNLTTGTVIWTQTNNLNVGGNNHYVHAITADGTGIYVAGADAGIGGWRIEKRSLATGTLIAAFGTAGVVTSNPSINYDHAYAITADVDGIYVTGNDRSINAYDQWRIEKRDPTTGALIAAFGTSGSVTSNPGSHSLPHAITADASGIYVVGTDWVPGNPQWRIEKRDKITGGLIGAFGTAGVINNNPSGGYDIAYALTADASGIYVAGFDESPGNGQWRIEKHDLITGILICEQTNNPSSGWDRAHAVTANASGIYVAGTDMSPGSLDYQWRIEKYDLCGGAGLTTSVISQNLLCSGQCIGIATASTTGGTIPYTYNWSNGQITQTATGLCVGNYTITVTDLTAATTTATITITQPATLTAAITSTSTSCGNTNGTATATASGGTGGYIYSWNSSGQTTSTATGLGAGTYTTTVTDANGCTATQTVAVGSSGSVINTNQSASICFGSTYTLPGGTMVSIGGVYADTLTSVTGCDSIITTTLTVNAVPTAVVSSIPTMSGQVIIITQGQSVTLTALGVGTYSWSNGSNNSSITVIPPTTTIYCVTVTDANNCTDTACVTVTIEQLDCSNTGEIFMPNAFSPNDDGENDVLKIYFTDIRCIKKLKFIIYDRWGEKVFTTTNPVAEWDGFYKGKLQNTAVFVYYLEATLFSGEKMIKRGNISLIK